MTDRYAFDSFGPSVPPPVPRRVRSHGARTADTVISVLLWLVQCAIAFFAATTLPLVAMVTDNCGYVTCGSENWVWVGVITLWVTAALGVLVFGGVLIRRSLADRPTWLVALVGIATQVAFAVLGVVMILQAGEI
ncbi:MAG: hypothetical protein QM728_01160 [Gordonia sp. (in: high G+C Gram-positive bacteria)]|uniref:hypothetical protein n=1 Tax=Gordonia sp. (in: high G+C Gram-positive bacteria) TaxID=84139 RepID=UPI0039E36C8D